jgi:iron complex transport system permease protein
VGLVLVAIVMGAMIGPAGPDWWRVPLAIADRLPLVTIDHGVTDAEWNIIWQIRMPRVVLAGIVGAMLSLAGASYQGVFRNPLVDPYLLGAAAGAGSAPPSCSRSAGAPRRLADRPGTHRGLRRRAVDRRGHLSGGDGVRRGQDDRHAGAGRRGHGVAHHGDPDLPPAAELRGGPRGLQLDPREAVDRDVGRRPAVLPYVVVSSIVLLLHRRHLDLLRVGDDEAATLGAPVARIRLVVVVAATLGTAAVVAVSGLIGFVGLVVPHAVRLLAGSSYRRLLPLTMAFGAAFLILADIPGRVLTNPAETPIGVVTAFLGAPFFIVLLRTRQVPR